MGCRSNPASGAAFDTLNTPQARALSKPWLFLPHLFYNHLFLPHNILPLMTVLHISLVLHFIFSFFFFGNRSHVPVLHTSTHRLLSQPSACWTHSNYYQFYLQEKRHTKVQGELQLHQGKGKCSIKKPPSLTMREMSRNRNVKSLRVGKKNKFQLQLISKHCILQWNYHSIVFPQGKAVPTNQSIGFF